jgi:deoxyadenosine/deoxycytidine kinase
MTLEFNNCVGKKPAFEVTFIAVEGNIAAGKSTLLEQLRRKPTRLADLLFGVDGAKFDYARVVPEPLDRWMSVGAEGTDLLAAMYADPAGNAMACQMNIVNTQLDAIVDELRSVMSELSTQKRDLPDRAVRVLIVTERSTLSGMHVFASSMAEKGRMPPAHWAVYCESFEAAHALYRERVVKALGGGDVGVHCRQLGYVLLQCAPEQARARAEKRGRPAEAALSLSVFEELDRRHRKVFALRNNEFVSGEIVWVDAAALGAVLNGKAKASVLQLSVLSRKKVVDSASKQAAPAAAE